MKNIVLIAINTMRQIRRHRIFYAISVGAVCMVGAGMVLGSLSLSEKVRVSINFSLVACHIGLVLMTLYFASTLLSVEFEKRTIIMLFSRPVSKLQFITGKFLV